VDKAYKASGDIFDYNSFQTIIYNIYNLLAANRKVLFCSTWYVRFLSCL